MAGPHTRRLLSRRDVLHLGLAASASVFEDALANEPKALAVDRARRLAAIRSWAYQLRFFKFSELAQSPVDLLVMDHALSGGRRFIRLWEPHEIAPLKQQPDGSRRLVLAYISIGEAERYRFYFDQTWHEQATRPPWLGTVNPLWDGNYLTEYWHPQWQALIFGSPQAYLERILDQGFDGIYIDRVDAFQDFKDRKSARSEMIDFLTRLVAHARRLDPRLLVVMQNAEELSAERRVLDAIDGIAKEDLFYGEDHTENANAADAIGYSLANLKRGRQAGKRIFTVEYLEDQSKIAIAAQRARAEGFLPYFAPRGLDYYRIDQPPAPPTPGRPK